MAGIHTIHDAHVIFCFTNIAYDVRKVFLPWVNPVTPFGCGTLCLVMKYFGRILLKISSKPRYIGIRLAYTQYMMRM